MSLKPYFLTRVGGRALIWSFEGGPGRFGKAYKRTYEISVRGIEADVMLASVHSADYDRDGTKLAQPRRDHGVARVRLRGLADPVDALESAARTTDPIYFEGVLQAAPVVDPDSDSELIEQRIRDLDDADKRGKDESPPKSGSLKRFRAFWKANANLAAPELFSSNEGIVRARWQDGAERTLVISFPDVGPLGWSLAVPRVGGYGLRRVNARCNDDQDIMPMAALLGVRSTK